MSNVSLFQRYRNFLDKVTEACAVIAVVALTIMMFLTSIDVVCRMLSVTLLGAFELIEFTMAIVVPLSIAYCEKRREHICVNLIVKYFPRPVQPWFDLITSIVTFLLYFIIAYECWLNTKMFMVNQTTTPVLLWAVWPVTIPCIIGFLLTALLLINHCTNVMKQIRTGCYELA